MCQTLMFPSLYPANNFFPRQFQVKEVHIGCLTGFLPSLVSLGLTSSQIKWAMGLLSVLIKSYTLIPTSVAVATHYNLGLNEMELMGAPAWNSLA